jgi:hypothetical protein
MIAQHLTRPDMAERNAARDRSASLDRLHREMTALFGILPGGFMHASNEAATDAEIEAQFDNMPV